MSIHGIGHGFGNAMFGFGRRGFGALDSDDDGNLTKAERESAGQKLPGGKNVTETTESDATGRKPFASRFDIRSEIRADMRDLLLQSQEERLAARDLRRAERLMERADGDGDGLLTEAELATFAEKVEPGSRMAQRVELLSKYFDAANSDGEGGVSTDEIAGFLGELRNAYRDYVAGLQGDDAFGRFLAERFGTGEAADAETRIAATVEATDATTASEPIAAETEPDSAAPAVPFYGRRFGFFGERREMLLKYFETADADASGGLSKDEVRGFFKEIRSAFRDFVARLRDEDAFGQFLDARFAPATAEPATEVAPETGETTTVTTTTTTVTTTTTTA